MFFFIYCAVSLDTNDLIISSPYKNSFEKLTIRYLERSNFRMFATVFSSKELYTPPTTAFSVLLEVVVVYCEIVIRYLLTGEGCILAVLDYCHVRYIIVTS